MYHSFLIHSSADGHLGCFHVLAIINSAARDTYRLKAKGWKKIYHANRDQKKAGVAILISDKTDFEIKAVKRDKHTT